MSRKGVNAGEQTLLQWAERAAESMQRADLFFGHGTATAFDEACWMISHVLDLPPDFDAAMLAARLRAGQADRLDRLLRERIDTRKPLAYLIGEAWFAGLRFRVDEDALVPRSPLAELVAGGLLPWLDLDRALHVLDVGTGSGCIAAALAWHWPELRVDAADVSPAALAIAEQNVARLGLADRVRLIESDVYAGLDAAGEDRSRYDLIVSNPPYVPAASMAQLPEEYRHEPALALHAGEDGLDIVRQLLAGAPEHLNPSGFLLLEVGEAQPATEALLGGIESIWLEFEHGGEGVVLLDRAACLDWRLQNDA
ncbi:MAG: 50S ribosomal protein L3 N(5)-glutamine methyltransferase [Wenzhouxiangellaceae bacterium]|jgi:ribosomal protein L3 glutamine methyltransferase|nr:50S ribosomal protein L3 N(5)-glutamine methyltransferase [Wenzhouxiangellaceae bacterium]MBS3823306.1 50S ribosomal protein L3 N(5)-glutamine methyltransferase [Wenzhouxiangellaceae bacterium]